MTGWVNYSHLSTLYTIVNSKYQYVKGTYFNTQTGADSILAFSRNRGTIFVNVSVPYAAEASPKHGRGTVGLHYLIETQYGTQWLRSFTSEDFHTRRTIQS